MSFLKVKNRPLFFVALSIVLWLLFVNVFQRFSVAKKVENLNAELKLYSTERPDHFESLVLNLSTNRGVWDDTKHRVVTLLKPEHCELSYWMSSKGSNSLARINMPLHNLDIDGITEGEKTVEIFLIANAPSIIVELLAREMRFEECFRIGGYFSGGCRYEFLTRSVRFFTLNPVIFRQKLKHLIMQCGGGGGATKP
jgi:hypothetical protein